VAGLLLTAATAASADDTADYSRFSDGPRRVPEPRGASRARAEALGLGTRRAAARLLRTAPEPRWRAAVRGAPPRTLAFPVEDARIGRGFGFTRQVRRRLHHDGVDIGAPEGTVVRAVADGIVAYSDNGLRGYGNCIMIIHAGGWVSFYAHLARNTVQPGWRVTRAERIGFVGSTGISRGPHLHFELRIEGELVDPARHFVRPPARAHARRDADPGDDGIGTRALARRVLSRAVPTGLDDRTSTLRRFRNLLWPVRGGRLRSSGRRGATIAARRGAPVRAAADGVVIYAGDRVPRLGRAIVLLHREGWVTAYGAVDQIDVRPGDRVLRGHWMGRTGGDLRFVFRDRGRGADPEALLVQMPVANDV
jgi:murein DD-endopeptidase MepM/ murein hydrolase activator NlpD